MFKMTLDEFKEWLDEVGLLNFLIDRTVNMGGKLVLDKFLSLDSVFVVAPSDIIKVMMAEITKQDKVDFLNKLVNNAIDDDFNRIKLMEFTL